MRSGRPLVPFELSEPTRKQLQSLANSRSTPHGLVRRAEIVLLAADGWPNQAIARCLSTSPATVGKWRKRFVEQGLMGLYDELRPGTPRSIDDEQVAAVVYRTLHEKPEHQTQWTVRSMAAASGISKDTVHRIWRTFGLQPHRHKTFKLSTDPFFVEKVRDIVGLYLNPPEHALVLCVDEKSQIQALERSQPLLPVGLGLCGRGYPRLQAPRHHDPVCRPGHRHRRSDDPVQAPSSAPGVSPVPTPHRGQRAPRPRRACRGRQLQHPQARQGQAMAGSSPPISPSLHPHLCFVAQPGRDLVRPPHAAGDSTRLLQEGEGIDPPALSTSRTIGTKRPTPSYGRPRPNPSSQRSKDFVSVFLRHDTSTDDTVLAGVRPVVALRLLCRICSAIS